MHGLTTAVRHTVLSEGEESASIYISFPNKQHTTITFTIHMGNTKTHTSEIKIWVARIPA